MNPHTAQKLTDAGSYAPRSGPLSDANLGFHESYNRLVHETLFQLGDTIPVVAMIGDYLSLLNDGGERSEQVIPDRYHQLKSLSHFAFGLQLCLMRNGAGPLQHTTQHELEEKLVQIKIARDGVSELPADERAAPTTLLDRSRELITEVLARGALDQIQLQEYASAIAPLVFKTAAIAVRLELDRMHELVSQWSEQLGADRWQRVYVVICDNHQPRYRHAARQYFGRLLHEQEGIAAEYEDRIIFGEGIRDTDGALDLLARHLIDQKASHMIFGDKSRLQKDMLADVAAEYLEELLPRTE